MVGASRKQNKQDNASDFPVVINHFYSGSRVALSVAKIRCLMTWPALVYPWNILLERETDPL
jgi:hypothetical protein